MNISYKPLLAGLISLAIAEGVGAMGGHANLSNRYADEYRKADFKGKVKMWNEHVEPGPAVMIQGGFESAKRLVHWTCANGADAGVEGGRIRVSMEDGSAKLVLADRGYMQFPGWHYHEREQVRTPQGHIAVVFEGNPEDAETLVDCLTEVGNRHLWLEFYHHERERVREALKQTK